MKTRDYTGALALLEFNRKVGEDDELKTLLWIGYCAFHLGEYQKAFDRYQEICNHHMDGAPPEVLLYQGCCLYYLQMYKQAGEKVEEFSQQEQERFQQRQERALSQANVMERKQELQLKRSKEYGGGAKGSGGAGSKMLSDEEVRATIVKELKEEHASDKAPEMALKNRLLFHLAHKMDDQEKLMMRHQDLTDTQGGNSIACKFKLPF